MTAWHPWRRAEYSRFTRKRFSPRRRGQLVGRVWWAQSQEQRMKRRYTNTRSAESEKALAWLAAYYGCSKSAVLEELIMTRKRQVDAGED